ncbi:30S ribosomal protein S17 [Candidatus Poribacteria bacterium]|nr:30S ribosomal protein S17 [Candidatus Poribacteria bacterium]
MSEQSQRKTRIGIVTGNSMDKTASVLVERRIEHPLYKRVIKRSKKYLVHDENNECKMGDKIRIEETRPLSKRKSWKLLEILERIE